MVAITVISKIKRHFNCMPKNSMVSTRELTIHGTRSTIDSSLHILLRCKFIVRVERGIFIKAGAKWPTREEIDIFKARCGAVKSKKFQELTRFEKCQYLGPSPRKSVKLTQMTDSHYTNPRLAEIYDLDSGWSEDRDFYLGLAGRPGMSILDLGCGTGLLCNAYAEVGHHVTGVDPSAAMLEVARRKPHAAKIEWIKGTAQTFNLEKRFDLIIMTGHAFQVLLEDADVRAAFETMKKHLKPSGKIVFESRNPKIDWGSKWDYELRLPLKNNWVVESRSMLSFENNRMVFELSYKFDDEELVSTSELRFMSKTEIENCLMESGLQIEAIAGDWNGAPFDEKSSEEIIFVVTSEERGPE